MKTNRQSIITDIIKNNEIETQEELSSELARKGIKVTQATISRDIKDLRLTKILSPNGRYIYSIVETNHKKHDERFLRIFSESIVSMEYANNIIVIKTLPGSANAATEAIDNLKINEILGTVAGDNTILVITRSNQEVENVLNKLKSIIKL